MDGFHQLSLYIYGWLHTKGFTCDLPIHVIHSMNAVTMPTQFFVHDSMATISKRETFLQDFLEILKRTLQNISKILKCFLRTTCIVLYVAGSNLQLHSIVLPLEI